MDVSFYLSSKQTNATNIWGFGPVVQVLQLKGGHTDHTTLCLVIARNACYSWPPYKL